MMDKWQMGTYVRAVGNLRSYNDIKSVVRRLFCMRPNSHPQGVHKAESH